MSLRAIAHVQGRARGKRVIVPPSRGARERLHSVCRTWIPSAQDRELADAKPYPQPVGLPSLAGRGVQTPIRGDGDMTSRDPRAPAPQCAPGRLPDPEATVSPSAIRGARRLQRPLRGLTTPRPFPRTIPRYRLPGRRSTLYCRWKTSALTRYGSGRLCRPARTSRRRCLAGPQGPAQAASARDRLRTHQDCCPAATARGAGPGAAAGRVRRVRGPLPLRRDRRSGREHPGGAGRPGLGQAHGPLGLRRCRLGRPRWRCGRVHCAYSGCGGRLVKTTLLARQHFALYPALQRTTGRIAQATTGRRQDCRRPRPVSRRAPQLIVARKPARQEHYFNRLGLSSSREQHSASPTDD